MDVLSLYVGQPLLSFHCSEQVSCDTIVNHIKGMAATGNYNILSYVPSDRPTQGQAPLSKLYNK